MTKLDNGRGHSFRIKRDLLRRAWDGVSSRTPAEMIALILEYQRRGREISASHQSALDDFTLQREQIQECIGEFIQRKEKGEYRDTELERYIIRELEAYEEKRRVMIDSGVPAASIAEPSPALIKLNAIETQRNSGRRWNDKQGQDQDALMQLALTHFPTMN